MLLSRAWLVPHLPTLVLDEHRRHRTAMLEALAAVAGQLVADPPEVIVAMSARWNTPGPFRVDGGRQHKTLTDYTGFGVELRYDCIGHPALAKALVEIGERAKLPVGLATRGVDSGVTVPLHFLLPGRRLPVVPLSLPPRAASECRAWGATLRRALAARDERVAFVIGGVLSLNLHAWQLKREVPESQELDRWAIDAVTRGAWADLAGVEARRRLAAAQPESELRHYEVMRGFLGGDHPGTLLAYEAGPGVGSALFEFALESSAEPAAREG